MLLAAPTGVGKSTWAVQAAILWGGGWSMCGIEAARPLRVSLIQAENDEGDLAEMRDGVLHGLAGDRPSTDLTDAAARVTAYTECSHAGDRFPAFLGQVIAADRPDLVIVDPVFSYLGADASDQAAVSTWLRNGIQPVLQAHGAGLLLLHHTNKPKPTDAETFASVGSLSYAGSGSSEWSNWPRAILSIQRTGREGVFRLIAPKRGNRLRWRTDDEATRQRFIAYAREPGLMYWREADPEEVKAARVVTENRGGRTRNDGAAYLQHREAAVELALSRAWIKSEFRVALHEKFGLSNKQTDELYRLVRDDVRVATGKGPQHGKSPRYYIGSPVELGKVCDRPQDEDGGTDAES
jgi:hypothetical protein